MHFSSALLLSFSLALARSVLADVDAQISHLAHKTRHGRTTKRDISSPFEKRQSCEGTCQTCFGSGYLECPGSDVYCYNPDLGSASSQCSGGSGGSPTSSPNSESTGTNTCFQRGASCATCFGPGSIDCPSGSDYDCYDPSEWSESEGCNNPGSSGSSSSGGSSSAPAPTGVGSSQCEDQFGAGSVTCQEDYCYNPTQGETCCADGSHCPADTRCVASGSSYKCQDSSSSSAGSITRTSSRPLSSAMGTGLIGGGSAETSSSSRATRTTSSTSSSTAQSTGSALGSSSDGQLAAAPSLNMVALVSVTLVGGVLGLAGFL